MTLDEAFELYLENESFRDELSSAIESGMYLEIAKKHNIEAPLEEICVFIEDKEEASNCGGKKKKEKEARLNELNAKLKDLKDYLDYYKRQLSNINDALNVACQHRLIEQVKNLNNQISEINDKIAEKRKQISEVENQISELENSK